MPGHTPIVKYRLSAENSAGCGGLAPTHETEQGKPIETLQCETAFTEHEENKLALRGQ